MNLPDTVVSSIRSGRVVLFLGTGALAGSQNHEGNKIFSEDLLRDALSIEFLDGQYNQDPLQWVAELAISETNLGTVQDFIAEKLKDAQPAQYHRILPTFRWKAIVTVSLDRLAENIYEKSENRAQKLVPIISNNDQMDEKIISKNDLPLLKLHGCVTRTQDPKLPFILAADQYSTHKEGRDCLFKTFYEYCSEYTVIFIGKENRDSELRSVLLQTFNEVKNHPPYYLVRSRFTDTEKKLWESKGVNILEGSFEDFIQSIDKSIDKKIRPLAQALQIIDHPIERQFT
ncbi:MAG: SIR2 family protein, partial [Cyanobacteria bacterium]|nr:SIR2 family protein [Cyanobacteriota bacterium]